MPVTTVCDAKKRVSSHHKGHIDQVCPMGDTLAWEDERRTKSGREQPNLVRPDESLTDQIQKWHRESNRHMLVQYFRLYMNWIMSIKAVRLVLKEGKGLGYNPKDSNSPGPLDIDNKTTQVPHLAYRIESGLPT